MLGGYIAWRWNRGRRRALIMHAEEGVAFRAIAAAIGRALDLPVEPRTREHFGWLAGFVGTDAPVSSARTRALTGWKPTGPTCLPTSPNRPIFPAKLKRELRPVG